MPTTQNQYGQIFGQGVKYLKINRFDSGGLDRSDYLGQLTNLTINYDDLGPIQYNIVTTQEQDTYFVYGIQTKNQSTSSVNFEVLDYTFTSSKANIQGATANLVKIKNYSSITGDTLGYFDTASGVYTFGNTPNIPITVSLTISNVANSSTEHRLYKNQTQNSYSSIIGLPDPNNLLGSITGNGNFTLVLTGSNTLIETETLAVYVVNPDVSANATVSMSISMNNSLLNPAISSLILFNPEFIDWDYNDYNALFGNAENPQFSSYFMDVDYTSTFTSPVNFDLIISGTADMAQVQDSNYNSYTWSTIRYNGSRYNSYKQQ